MHFN